jgi:hypothetical protein
MRFAAGSGRERHLSIQVHSRRAALVALSAPSPSLESEALLPCVVRPESVAASRLRKPFGSSAPARGHRWIGKGAVEMVAGVFRVLAGARTNA